MIDSQFYPRALIYILLRPPKFDTQPSLEDINSFCSLSQRAGISKHGERGPRDARAFGNIAEVGG